MKPQMNADERRLEINGITEAVIGCVMQVSNTLGSGFLEKVYENALALECRRSGLAVVRQKAVQIKYRDVVVGDYIADLVVNDRVLVEVKAIKLLDEVHAAQCMNYLKATNLNVGLLINFGRPKAEIRRIVQGF